MSEAGRRKGAERGEMPICQECECTSHVCVRGGFRTSRTKWKQIARELGEKKQTTVFCCRYAIITHSPLNTDQFHPNNEAQGWSSKAAGARDPHVARGRHTRSVPRRLQAMLVARPRGSTPQGVPGGFERVKAEVTGGGGGGAGEEALASRDGLLCHAGHWSGC